MAGFSVDGLIRQHGRSFTLSSGKEGRAVIQPLRYKNKLYLEEPYSSVGRIDQSFYLYIGPPSLDLTEEPSDVQVCTGKNRYLVIRTKKVYFSDRPLYIWAVLRKVVEGE